MALVLVPLLFLVALELLLRVGGYGHPTTFLLKKEFNGKTYYVENPSFGFLFFPPGMARSPTPMRIPAEKDPGTIRIFVFGESAALGDPKPAYGLSRYLETLLKGRLPGKKFEVICAAMTAINSHAVLSMAKECARLNGDLWVIYMGNNEMIGPFGATGVLGRKTPGLGVIRATLALKHLRVGQLVGRLMEKTSGAIREEWNGLGMFVENQVAPEDPARKIVEDYFRQNLSDIISAGEAGGAKVLLCTVAGNLKDCSPYGSMHSDTLGSEQRRQWDAFYQKGMEADAGGRAEEAVNWYQQAAAIDPSYAELQFRLAGVLEKQSNPDAAAAAYKLARDVDTLPFRTTTQRNAIIREMAANRHLALVDVQEALNTGNHIAGSSEFFDHVHFTPEGNYKAARVIASEIEKTFPSALQRNEAWAPPEECEKLLALTDWNRYLACEAMLIRFGDAPYTNQITNPKSRQILKDAMARMRLAVKETDSRETRQLYEKAIAASPEDYYLHQNFAEFLELAGNFATAISEWRIIQQLLPHHPLAYFHSGRLLNKRANFSEARVDLRKALEIRDDFTEARLELGGGFLLEKRFDEALAVFQEILRHKPGNADAHFRMAQVYGAKNDRGKAMEHLQATVRARPNHWEARYYLGVELAVQDKVDEAAVQFREVVRLRPNHALGHYNLGVALARQRRFPEAMNEFETTLKLDPGNQNAIRQMENLRSLYPGGQQLSRSNN